MEYIKGFYRLKNTAHVDTIMFGIYNNEGGTFGEMAMDWVLLNNKITPKLEVFDDSFKVLSTLTDMISKLGEWDDKNITPEQFSDLLLDCGFIDKYQDNSQLEGDNNAIQTL